MDWPPTLDMLKLDQGIPVEDTRDDARHQFMLDAAVSEVERVRPQFNYTADPLLFDVLPAPTVAHILGTIRLAVRWFTRVRSPDGMVTLGDLGAGRVTSFDSDIDRMLRIGRFAVAVVA